MTGVTGYIRGRLCYYDGDQWRHKDDDESVSDICPRCNLPPTKEGYDACLGFIPGVHSACCGHGVEGGYIVTKDEFILKQEGTIHELNQALKNKVQDLTELRELAKLAMEVIDDDLEERPPRHSLGNLYARLKHILGENNDKC